MDEQKLMHCFGNNKTCMDEMEQMVINECLLKYLVMDLNMNKISQNLHAEGYIREDMLKNVQRFLERGKKLHEKKVNARIINYLKHKVSFAAFLWALTASDYQNVANLLSESLEKATVSEITPAVKKAPIVKSRYMHVLVKKLKFVTDSNIFHDPVIFIRRLAIRFKDTFNAAAEMDRKRKMADRYVGVLAVELDNFSFLDNKFVKIRSLEAELRRVVPYTSNPVMNEALVNSRMAEMIAIGGDVKTAKSMIQDVMTVIYNTEECPESGNLVYQYLNVMLRDYEDNSTAEKKKHYIQMGYNGLRMLRVLDNEVVEYLKVSYMIRIIFCALDLSISGRPLCIQQCPDSFENARYLLTEVGELVQTYGLRKTMCYSLAKGRMLHLTGNLGEALVSLNEAKRLAEQAGFIEHRNLSEYVKSISPGDTCTGGSQAE